MAAEDNRAPQRPVAGQHLNRLAYFVAVVETGSFTAAADRLGVTKAVVSQQVARLEQQFGATLLIRTTRRVRTTEAGQAFYQRCALILREAQDAFDALAASSSEPTGTLTLTAPFDYGIRVVVPAIARFRQLYPRCEVDARFSDKVLDVAADRFDLAIRVGWVTEQHLQARRIGRFAQKLVAAPAWRDVLQAISEPQALATLPLIANLALREPSRIVLSKGGRGNAPMQREDVVMRPALSFNETLAVHEAAKRGAGLAMLPDFLVDDDLAEGALIPVLADWALPSGDICVVFPSARYRPTKVKAFIEVLTGMLADAETVGTKAL